MTAALVVLVFVAMSFANSSLTTQMAGDEFSANKQFMQSTGLQIDNVAWTIGRTETVDFTAKYGQVTFVPNVINYTIRNQQRKFMADYLQLYNRNDTVQHASELLQLRQ